MKRRLLFSQLTEKNKDVILGLLLPEQISGKTLAYMPSSGVSGSEEYIAQWNNMAIDRHAKFVTINNTTNDSQEYRKLLNSNILLISGGNTFQLLHNLRQSGLNKAIVEFSQKQDAILAGFSAGALVLTPTIKICNLPGFDDNTIGLKDLDSLNIVNFEVFPHYNKDLHEKMLADYQKSTKNRVREISDEDYICIDL